MLLLDCSTFHRFFFKKWASPGLFLIYFRLFKHTLQILQQINLKKCPSSIWCRDLNSWPLKHESPPITTRPGLPPFSTFVCWLYTYFDDRVQRRLSALVSVTFLRVYLEFGRQILNRNFRFKQFDNRLKSIPAAVVLN